MSTALEMSEATKSVGGLNVSYRPGTADEIVLDLVLAHNRYGFPTDMTGMTVVDIGAHIGSATMLCASLDSHYVCSRISNCEYRWDHR